MITNIIHNENCLTGLKKVPDNSIDCCVTSPPYYGLRDYGTTDQIGLEETPTEFVEALKQIFEEVKRVLKPEGTLWLNLGDSYASGAKNRTTEQVVSSTTLRGGTKSQEQSLVQKNKIADGLKPKDLIGIPWRVAFALQAAGWFLRQDIIWHKPYCMPESVTDRCTKNHEYIFLLSKSERYYFDRQAIQKPMADSTAQRMKQNIDQQEGSTRANDGRKTNGNMKAVGSIETKMVNKRSVWTVGPAQFSEAHFATFPEDLIVDCIKAGCPEGGLVLDPFMGAGTTALVSRKLNRNYVGFELNPEYMAIADKRLRSELGMFL